MLMGKVSKTAQCYCSVLHKSSNYKHDMDKHNSLKVFWWCALFLYYLNRKSSKCPSKSDAIWPASSRVYKGIQPLCIPAHSLHFQKATWKWRPKNRTSWSNSSNEWEKYGRLVQLRAISQAWKPKFRRISWRSIWWRYTWLWNSVQINV